MIRRERVIARREREGGRERDRETERERQRERERAQCKGRECGTVSQKDGHSERASEREATKEKLAAAHSGGERGSMQQHAGTRQHAAAFVIPACMHALPLAEAGRGSGGEIGDRAGEMEAPNK